MKITSITKKTVAIDIEPGERVMVDAEGFGLDSVVLRFCGDENIRQSFLDVVRNINANREKERTECNFLEYSELQQQKSFLISKALDSLPVYRSKLVFVGNNF